MTRAVLTTVLLASAACSTVRSSALPAYGVGAHRPYRGPMAVSVTRDPPDGTVMGAVEASGGPSIAEVIPEFIERAAGLGGNVARIDRIVTRYQWVSRPVTQSYSCGSPRFPQYCTRTYMQNEEVATIYCVGRAIRVER